MFGLVLFVLELLCSEATAAQVLPTQTPLPTTLDPPSPTTPPDFTFLPYGPDFDEQTNYHEKIFMNVPIVFYRKELQEVYILLYGVINFHFYFHHDLDQVVPTLPRTSYPVFPFIAPLRTALTSESGLDIYWRMTEDLVDLLLVKEMIQGQNPALSDYEPSLALVATWHNFMLPDGQFVTYQAILSTDGRVSFAAFLYDDATIDAIEKLSAAKLIGFDAGDGIKSATVHYSQGNSSIPNLDPVNIFRIDGHCITTVLPSDVCDLYSYAVKCDDSLSAMACRCHDHDSVQDQNTSEGSGEEEGDQEVHTEQLYNTSCDANATFSCGPGSFPSICPEESEFLGCFPEELICDLVQNCPEGNDEVNCTDYGFIPFGDGVGDYNPRVYDDEIAVDIVISVPVVFYQNRQTEIFASSNGLLTFVDGNEYYAAHPFPYARTPTIAPLWADFYLSVSGSIYYREASDQDTLDRVVEMIAGVNPELGEEYHPTLAVVVTWFEVPLIRRAAYNVTFQIVLSTDGKVSFCGLIYRNISSISSGSDFPEAHGIGFDAGNLQTGFNLLFIEEDDDDEEEEEETHPMNFELEGVNIFRIDGSCITTVKPGEVCSLDAVSTECDGNLAATTCTCDEGYQYSNSACIDKSSTLAAGVASGIFVALLVLLVAITVPLLVIRRRRTKLRDQLAMDSLVISRSRNESQIGEGNEYFQRLKKMSVVSNLSLKVPKSLIINSCNLQLGKTVGQGEFGIVYKALLKRSFTANYSETVAVKTLKGFLDEALVDDLLEECTKMLEFNHPNVLTLIGVCLDGGPAPYIVMPFMTNGSLLSHIKENRSSLLLDPTCSDPDDTTDTQKKLVNMCIQVAKGMAYLISKRLIHRDLAARNCMIDSGFVIKVADFGMSESIDTTKDYFRQGQGDTIKLPIKWLAPESINDGLFSEKTDVWAYGVTCWEVFSGGKTPYPGVHPMELARQLDTGYRMEKPLNAACSDEIYTEMRKCWEARPELRPHFSELVISLSSFLETMADYFDFTGGGIATTGL